MEEVASINDIRLCSEGNSLEYSVTWTIGSSTTWIPAENIRPGPLLSQFLLHRAITTTIDTTATYEQSLTTVLQKILVKSIKNSTFQAPTPINTLNVSTQTSPASRTSKIGRTGKTGRTGSISTDRSCGSGVSGRVSGKPRWLY